MAAEALIPAHRASALRSPELQLLVGAALGDSTDALQRMAARIADWPKLFRVAERHGLRAAAYHGLAAARIDLPGSMGEAWRTFAEENARRNLRLTGELLRIMLAFDSAAVRALPYKGPALAAVAHASISSREIADLDLLVAPEDAPRAEAIARDLGYAPVLNLTPRQRASYLRHECETDLVAGENLLDLHWALVPRHYQIGFDFDGCWTRRAVMTLGGARIATLSPQDGLLGLAIHGSKHAWERLSWVVDFALWISAHPQLDWEAAAREAQRLRASRALELGLLVCEGATGIEPPSHLKPSGAADAQLRALAAEILARFERGESLTDAQRWRAMLRLQSGGPARLRCLASFAFSSGVAEWSSVRLPDVLFPLYVPVRMGRIIRALFS